MSDLKKYFRVCLLLRACLDLILDSHGVRMMGIENKDIGVLQT